MRVLLATQYFSPELTAAALRLEPFAGGLAALGHDVDVVCEVPSHPAGIVYEGFGGHTVERRRLDGVEVNYVWTYARPSKSTLTRLGSYGTYAAMASIQGVRRKRPDVIVASSPPLTVGAVGALLARRFSVPWVLDVRDLWPEVAGAVGRVQSRRVLAAAARGERWLYRDAAAVTTVTEPFRRHVLEIRDRPGVHLLPNGTSELWLGGASIASTPEGLGLPPGFLLTYAGNVGLSQGVEVAIDAIRSAGPGHNLLVIGDGAGRPGLERVAADLGPGRVTFLDPMTPEQILPYLRASSALLVSLADNPALGKTIPIKLYDYAAVNTPMIVSTPGEAARIALEKDMATIATPGDAESLAGAIRSIEGDRRRAETRAERAVIFARDHLRERQVPILERVLRDVSG